MFAQSNFAVLLIFNCYNFLFLIIFTMTVIPNPYQLTTQLLAL